MTGPKLPLQRQERPSDVIGPARPGDGCRVGVRLLTLSAQQMPVHDAGRPDEAGGEFALGGLRWGAEPV